MNLVNLPENDYIGFVACYELNGYYIDVFHTISFYNDMKFVKWMNSIGFEI